MPPLRIARSLAGPQAEWPDEAQVSLDIGRATSAGQELRPLVAKLGYGPKTISLDQLKIGQPDNVMMEGAGSFDRVNATGRLALNSSAASLGQITALIAPLAPALAVAAQCDGDAAPGPARLKLTLDLDKNAAAGRSRQCARRARSRRAAAQRASPRSPQSLTSPPCAASISMRSSAAKSASRSKLSSEQGGSLLALLGSRSAPSRRAKARRNSRDR